MKYKIVKDRYGTLALCCITGIKWQLFDRECSLSGEWSWQKQPYSTGAVTCGHVLPYGLSLAFDDTWSDTIPSADFDIEARR